MKIPRLLLAGCALISWTALNANAVNVEQGITSGDIQDIVKQAKMETKNNTTQIQPGPVPNWTPTETTDSCLDRSIQAMKKNTGSEPSRYELGEIAIMCAGAPSDAPGACFDTALQSLKENTGYGPSQYEIEKIAAMCVGAPSDAPGVCFDTAIQSINKNLGYFAPGYFSPYGPSPYELGAIADMCAGAQSNAPAACFDAAIQSIMEKNTGPGLSEYNFGQIAAGCAGILPQGTFPPMGLPGMSSKKIALVAADYNSCINTCNYTYWVCVGDGSDAMANIICRGIFQGCAIRCGQ